jgi:hypothetical protein
LNYKFHSYHCNLCCLEIIFKWTYENIAPHSKWRELLEPRTSVVACNARKCGRLLRYLPKLASVPPSFRLLPWESFCSPWLEQALNRNWRGIIRSSESSWDQKSTGKKLSSCFCVFSAIVSLNSGRCGREWLRQGSGWNWMVPGRGAKTAEQTGPWREQCYCHLAFC